MELERYHSLQPRHYTTSISYFQAISKLSPWLPSFDREFLIVRHSRCTNLKLLQRQSLLFCTQADTKNQEDLTSLRHPKRFEIKEDSITR